jgi:hypothetical protein
MKQSMTRTEVLKKHYSSIRRRFHVVQMVTMPSGLSGKLGVTLLSLASDMRDHDRAREKVELWIEGLDDPFAKLNLGQAVTAVFEIEYAKEGAKRKRGQRDVLESGMHLRHVPARKKRSAT